MRHLKAKSVKKVALSWIGEHGDPEFACAAVEGAILAGFDPDRYRTSNDKKILDAFSIVPGNASAAIDEAVERGRIIGEAQNFARDLVNEPANKLTPSGMAEAARKMAAEYHLDCEVLDRERMEQLGMGALLGVAQGSAEPPALIVIRYRSGKFRRPRRTWAWSGRASPSTPAASRSNPPTAWKR